VNVDVGEIPAVTRLDAQLGAVVVDVVHEAKARLDHRRGALVDVRDVVVQGASAQHRERREGWIAVEEHQAVERGAVLVP
jgi:exonuclease VII large subunit